MNEILDSVRHQINERLNSPLLMAYFLSWAAVNFKVIFAVLSDLEFVQKIEVIESALYVDWKAFVHAFGLPLIMAAAYIFLLPFPSRFALSFTLNQNRINRELQRNIDSEIPLTQKEADELKASLKSRYDDLLSDVDRRDQQIVRIKAELQDKDTLLANKNTEMVGLEHDLRDLQERLRSNDANSKKAREDNAFLQQAMDELKAKVVDLSELNSVLQAESARVKQELERSAAECVKLRAHLLALEEKNKRLDEVQAKVRRATLKRGLSNAPSLAELNKEPQDWTFRLGDGSALSEKGLRSIIENERDK